MPVRRNGNFQTPISVPAVRPKRCHTLSNPAHRQDYTVACLNNTLAPNAYDNNKYCPCGCSITNTKDTQTDVTEHIITFADSNDNC